jgi:hypothetical protein
MVALLRHELHDVATIHVEALCGVASLQRGELGRMPQRQPCVLRGMPCAERCLADEGPVNRLLMLGDVSVSQTGVLVAVSGVERLMRCQVPRRHSVVVVDVPTFDLGMIGRVPLADAEARGPGVLHHDHLLRVVAVLRGRTADVVTIRGRALAPPTRWPPQRKQR